MTRQCHCFCFSYFVLVILTKGGTFGVFTIVTPTYNRALLLSRVYESLCAQTTHPFEWVVVDDGSTDDTGRVVNSFNIAP